MADEHNESVERARKELEREHSLTEQSRAEYIERMKGKPTPTQEENDLAALGAHITEHEDDGSGPDPYNRFGPGTRSMEAGKSGSYQTRNVRPAGQQSTPPRRDTTT